MSAASAAAAMTAQEMPLLLDSAMQVDHAAMNVMDSTMALDDVDLFGDAVIDTALGELPTRPAISRQLQQRLDDLRRLGSCQSIAWSRQGTIASISQDGRSIELRFLRSHPDNGSWELSEASPCPFVPPLNGGPYTHLEWATTSSPELAVIDAVGRVMILNFSITLNRPYQLRRWESDPVDDLHAVVGCYWLPLVTPGRNFTVLYGPAVLKHGTNEYTYENSPVPMSRPYHPNPAKSALLCVTTNGFLKLFFSQHNNKFEETKLELESITASDDLITHASICSDKNELVIALVTASNQLKVVTASIQWGLPQINKSVPPGSMPLNPSLKERHLAVTSWFQHGSNEPALDSSMSQLSHIEILPTALQSQHPQKVQVPAVILTVRTHTPQDPSHFNQEVQSVIDRWEIIEQKPSTHPAFARLGGGAQGATSSPATPTRLRKLDPIIVPKVVLSIQSMQLGRVICFAFSDGTVQYFDRFTMTEIYHELDRNRIMSPHQVGFHFPDPTPCLQVAFSPTNCSFVQICEDGRVKWNSLQYPLEEPESFVDPPPQIRAALTIPVAAATINHINFDDILAIARPFAKKSNFSYEWIREIINALKIPVDYSEEAHHDQLMRNMYLQLCLSILNHLGFQGEFHGRAFGGKFAMLALNLRNILVLITIANNAPTNLQGKLNPLDEPEVVDAIAGCAKWALDLIAWLSDSLFNLLTDPNFMAMLAEPKRFSELSQYLNKQNDVSLYLILCSSTRGYLSAACRRLIHYDQLSRKAVHHFMESMRQTNSERPGRQDALIQAYRKMQHYTASSLVNVSEFETLINRLSADIRGTYQTVLPSLINRQAGASLAANGKGPINVQPGDQVVKKAQYQIELDMLLANNPPPPFREVLAKFFHNSLRDFRATTDPARLYFADFRLLGVDDEPQILAAKRAAGLRVDVFKRVPLVAANGSQLTALTDGHASYGAAVQNGGAGGPPDVDVLGNGNGAVGGGGDPGEAGPQYRRCIRCACVMEEMVGQRPGFTFVLAQQRKCPCGGSWGLLPKGSSVS